MTSDLVYWECGTGIYAGGDVWRAMSSGVASRPCTMLVVGAGFAAANFHLVEALRLHLGVKAGRVHLVQAPCTIEKVEELAGLLERADADGVVAVGGTSVLDLTRLACRHHADHRTVQTIRARGARRGVIGLPADSAAQLHRTFVPTTIGAAAAVRPTASVALRGHPRLVEATGLEPDVAVVDSVFTGSLSPTSIAEGIAASVIRAADWYVGDEGANLLTGVETRATVSLLVSLGVRAGDGRLTAADRLLAGYADIGQFGFPLAGHQPIVTAVGSIASELASEAGLSPNSVMPVLLPTVWQAIDDGDEQLGSRVRLRRVWSWIRAAGREQWPEEPGPGVAAMFRSWGLGVQLTCDSAAASAVGVRVLRFWEGSVPALSGRSAAEVACWVRTAVLVGVRDRAG